MAAGMTDLFLFFLGYNVQVVIFAYFYHLGQVTHQDLLLVELPLRLVVDHDGIHLLR